MSIFDKYDLVDVDEKIHIPEMPVNGVTLIVGSSGTGKTTILNKWGMKDNELDQNIPIVDMFESEEIAENYLITAGLRSVPCWRRPLGKLSNGERHRAEIAISLSKGDVFIDEYTSLVDRNTARALCQSLNKANIKNIVLATCHRDVLEWLDFDHVYDTDSSEWLDRGLLRRERTIELLITPKNPKEVWGIFKKHHYLSGEINQSANCWVAEYNGKPVAFAAVIAFPSGNWRDGWRGHRTVVLPEFQGMGIGSILSDTIAQHIVETGARYFSKTSHPAFGRHREKSDKWKATSKNLKSRKDYKLSNNTKEDGHKMSHAHRLCFSHEYIGAQNMVTKGDI